VYPAAVEERVSPSNAAINLLEQVAEDCNSTGTAANDSRGDFLDRAIDWTAKAGEGLVWPLGIGGVDDHFESTLTGGKATAGRRARTRMMVSFRNGQDGRAHVPGGLEGFWMSKRGGKRRN
jgi:hypothetical protein